MSNPVSTLRTLGRHPWYAMAAVLVLGLGIGSAAASFSLLNRLVLAPLDFDPTERAVAFWSGGNWSPAEFELVRERTRSLESVAAYSPGGRRLLHSPSGSEVVNVTAATGEFFRLFNQEARLGRALERQDEVAGAPAVAVLSEGYWHRRFGGDPSVIGTSLDLDGVAHIVVGVMPTAFWFPTAETDLWAAFQVDPGSSSYRFAHFLHLVGRLGEGASLDAARSDVVQLAAALQAEFEYREGFSKVNGAAMTSLRANLAGTAKEPLLILLGGVACLLLIACVNVAGLQINRMTARLPDRSVRISLGASKAGLVIDHLVESLALALSGGLLGVVAAYGMVEMASAALPPDTPRLEGVTIDSVALLWILLISLGAAVVVGLMPAAVTASTDLRGALGSARGPESRGPGQLRRWLVVGETALSFVLVVAAGLLAKSFASLLQVDPGFETESVLALEVAGPSEYDDQARAAVFEALAQRLDGLPMTLATGAVQRLPLSPGWSFSMEVEGAPVVEGSGGAPWRSVLPGFFETLGIGLVRGRTLNWGDAGGAPSVVVVNETFASTYWPDVNPLGRRVRTALPDSEWLTVVGVVEDSKVTGLMDDVPPTFYQPYAQQPSSSSLHFLARTNGDPRALAAAFRELVADVDANLAVSTVQSMNDIVNRTTRRPRGLTMLLGGLAGVSILLGALGLFSVTSQSVSGRTREIGLRMSLGAQRGSVVGLVIRDGLTLAAVGVAIGLGLSLVLTRSLESSLYGVTPTDAATWSIVVVCFVVTTLLASAIPALRAGRVDPMRALRQE